MALRRGPLDEMAAKLAEQFTDESNYLEFTALGPPSSQKLPWVRVNNKTGVTLGVVRFFGRWRAFVFCPDPNTAFNKGCLRQIADFCGWLTEEWRSTIKRTHPHASTTHSRPARARVRDRVHR